MGLGIGKDCACCGKQLLVTDSSSNICKNCKDKLIATSRMMESALNRMWENEQ